MKVETKITLVLMAFALLMSGIVFGGAYWAGQYAASNVRTLTIAVTAVGHYEPPQGFLSFENVPYTVIEGVTSEIILNGLHELEVGAVYKITYRGNYLMEYGFKNIEGFELLELVRAES